MKKLFLLISILTLTICVSFAQNETNNKTLSYSEAWFKFSGNYITGNDSIGQIDSTWELIVRKRTDEKVFANFYISLDSISGTSQTTNIYFFSKAHDNQAFAIVDTVVWHGTADTTFEFETTTALLADYWKILVEGQASTMKIGIDKVDGKFAY